MPLELFGIKVNLKSLSEIEIPLLWEMIYGQESPEWKRWDAPYFPLERKTLEEYKASVNRDTGYDAIAKFGIWNSEKLIGTVGYYWEHKPSNWLELGVSIYPKQYWSKGYGSEALKLWITHLFDTMPIVRVGLTTWSGNERMIKCAEKLGMLQEARLRKCRFWQGVYYDSIRFGVLREEWNS
ncbi:GNAT family N-acetyltransferase [bacterium]|nr:GNAT family N-acetyltransferase [bacterium]